PPSSPLFPYTTLFRSLFPIPGPRAGQTLVHVHPDANELNRVYHSQLALNASPIALSQALGTLDIPASEERSDWRKALRDHYLTRSEEHTSELQSRFDL